MNKGRKYLQKGFTLIELLAVIIILGILLLIAVPGISKYIEDSRISTYENNLKNYTDSVRNEVNAYSDEKYKFSTDEYLIVPISCIELEKGTTSKSPFSNYVDDNSFVLVTRDDSNNFDYYVTALDESGFGCPLSSYEKIKVQPLKDEDISSILPIGVNVGKYQSMLLSKTGKLVTCEARPSQNYVSTKILENNEEQRDTNIDFSKTSEEDGTKGLYYTSTNTEGGKPTYYFRGAVENNFVQFGQDTSGNDLYWRIIRINEDGSIRMIYNGTSVDATGTAVYVGASKFNEQAEENAHVGYMYGLTGQSGENAYNLTHSNDNPSTIKTFIDNWYTNDTNLSSLRETHLADAGFCNDRSVAPAANMWRDVDTALGYGSNQTFYGAYNRLFNEYQPQFACPNADNDLFTTSTSNKGNKALTNPIGLITVDETAYAGGAYNKSNNSYYLYIGYAYWTMSPGSLFENKASEWFVHTDGGMYGGHIKSGGSARPVINLQSTVELSDELPSGCTQLDGTRYCPYIIKVD